MSRAPSVHTLARAPETALIGASAFAGPPVLWLPDLLGRIEQRGRPDLPAALERRRLGLAKMRRS